MQCLRCTVVDIFVLLHQGTSTIFNYNAPRRGILTLSLNDHYLLDEDMLEEEVLHTVHVDIGISKQVVEQFLKGWES